METLRYSAVLLLVVVGVSVVSANPCLPGDLGCKAIDVAYVAKGLQGRKLFQTPVNSPAKTQSLAPDLTNRRSLLAAMCSDTDNSIDAIIDCTNAVRYSAKSFDLPCGTMNGYDSLGSLSKNMDLVKAAEAHSQDNARMGHLTHTGSDGSRASTRVSRFGYKHGVVRENIAFGHVSAKDVVFNWMCSGGHRDNIMSCDVADIGIGIATGSGGRDYHTQVFACPSGSRCSCSGGGGAPPSSSSPDDDKMEPKEQSTDDDKMEPKEQSPKDDGFHGFVPKDDKDTGDFFDLLAKHFYGDKHGSKPYQRSSGYPSSGYGGSKRSRSPSSGGGSYGSPSHKGSYGKPRYQTYTSDDGAVTVTHSTGPGHSFASVSAHSPPGGGNSGSNYGK